MKIDTVANRATLEREADINAECRARIRDYLARTGLAIPDFARRINYSPATLNHFLGDYYNNTAGTARQFVKAANEFMNTHPIGDNGTDRNLGELYDTANVHLIRDTFLRLLASPPAAYMIYAPPGSQKSFVLEHQVAELNRSEIANDSDGARRAFYIYARQNIRPRDLMRRIAVACGSRTSTDIEAMLQSIRFDLRHYRTLLVVDEAQHLSIECFETLRELLDQRPYCSLLFAGSHDLKRQFDQFSATLEQWNSRIVEKVRLPGLERYEAVGIINREIGNLLDPMPIDKSAALVDKLIASATVRDTFEGDRTYINVRTLTNSLNLIRSNPA